MTSKPHSGPHEIEVALEAGGDAARAVAQFYEAQVADLRKALEIDHEEARLRIESLEEQLETTRRELQQMRDAEAERLLTLDAILEREAALNPAREPEAS